MYPHDTPSLRAIKYVRCDDLHDFWLEWSSMKDLNRQYPWAYVYIAHRNQWKIGVSIHPWKRRGQVSASSIAFSRLVYQPYKLERGLHAVFAEKRRPWSEWFDLDPSQVELAKQLIDYWQLMSPIQSDFKGITYLFNRPPGYVDPIWEYDSFRDDLKFLRGK